MLRPRLTVVGFAFASALALALALVACSTDAPAPAVNGAAPVVTPVGPNNAGCSDSAPHPAGTTCVSVVHGQLLDSNDMGVSAPVTVSGADVLCTGSAAAEGLFSVDVNRFVDLSTFVLHVYGHPFHGDLVTRLPPVTTSDVLLNALPHVPIFEHKGDVLPPSTANGGVVRSGPVELTLAAGTTTVVAPAHENTRELRAGVVLDAKRWDADVIAMYAVGPAGALLSPSAAVAITLPDSAGVADGTIVNLVILSNDVAAGTAGTLLKVGSATVKGGIARSVAGSGIDRLSWVGVRVAKGG